MKAPRRIAVFDFDKTLYKYPSLELRANILGGDELYQALLAVRVEVEAGLSDCLKVEKGMNCMSQAFTAKSREEVKQLYYDLAAAEAAYSPYFTGVKELFEVLCANNIEIDIITGSHYLMVETLLGVADLRRYVNSVIGSIFNSSEMGYYSGEIGLMTGTSDNKSNILHARYNDAQIVLGAGDSFCDFPLIYMAQLHGGLGVLVGDSVSLKAKAKELNWYLCGLDEYSSEIGRSKILHLSDRIWTAVPQMMKDSGLF